MESVKDLLQEYSIELAYRDHTEKELKDREPETVRGMMIAFHLVLKPAAVSWVRNILYACRYSVWL